MRRQQSISKRKTFKRLSLAQKVLDKPTDLADLFDSFDRIANEQTRKMLLAQYHGKNFKLPAMGMIPICRYIPNRKTTQRLIMRAADLPDDFDNFTNFNLTSMYSPRNRE